MHSQSLCRLQVDRAVIDKAAFSRRFLGYLQREPVDVWFWLAQANETGADKQAEDRANPEFLDAIEIEVSRFIVDSSHQVLFGVGQLSCKCQSLGIRLR